MLWGVTVRSPHAHAQDRLARHLRGARDGGRARRPHPRGRARPEDLRARVRRPAGARCGQGALLRRAGRARRRGGAGAGSPRRRGGTGRVRAARAGRRHGAGDRAGAAPSRPADDGARVPRGRAAERRPAHGDPARRPRGRGGRDGERRLRHRHPGPGVPRARVGARGAGRRGRGRRLRRHPVAPRRPRPGRSLPRPRAGDGADPSRRRRRRLRRPRGPLDADPRRDAGAAHEAAGEDRLQPRGVVLRPRPPPPGADLVRAPGDASGRARQRAHEDPARRRRLRLELDRRHVERRVLRARPVQGRERADRVDLRLHEQSAVRRDARLRRRTDVLRRRGADGQARRRARDRSGRAAPVERALLGRPASDRPADRGRAAGRRRDPAGRGATGARGRAAAAGGDPAPGRGRQHDARRRGQARRRLRGRVQEHLLLGGVRRLHRRPRDPARGRLRRDPLRFGRGRTGRHRRDPPGRAHRARHRRRLARRPWHCLGRLRRLRVRVPDDLDGGRRRPGRLPRRARGAEAQRRRGRRRAGLPSFAHDTARPGDRPDHRRAGARLVRRRGDARRRRGRRRSRA